MNSSLLARLPEDARHDVIGWVGARAHLPLYVYTWSKSLKITRIGGAFAITEDEDEDEEIRTVCLDDPTMVVRWVLNIIVQHNKQVMKGDDGVNSCNVFIAFNEHPGVKLVHRYGGRAQDEAFKQDFRETLREQLDLVGHVFVFDQ